MKSFSCVIVGSLLLLSALGSDAVAGPSPEMEQLIKTFEGRWIVRETHASNGATGTGTAEFTRGPDQLEMLTIDRTGPFEANTYSGFLEYLLTPMLSVNARYDYQDRPEDVRVHRASVRLIHRF